MNTSNAVNPGMNCDPDKCRMEAALVQSEGEQGKEENKNTDRNLACSPPESQNSDMHLNHVPRDATKNRTIGNANSIHITSTF